MSPPECVSIEHSLMPRPSPEKRKEGLEFWMTLLVTLGGVKRHKDCNYCISHALHAY